MRSLSSLSPSQYSCPRFSLTQGSKYVGRVGRDNGIMALRQEAIPPTPPSQWGLAGVQSSGFGVLVNIRLPLSQSPHTPPLPPTPSLSDHVSDYLF